MADYDPRPTAVQRMREIEGRLAADRTGPIYGPRLQHMADGGPPKLPDLTSVPGGKRASLIPDSEASQSTIKRRLVLEKQALGEMLGKPVKRDVTQWHERGIAKLLDKDLLSGERAKKTAQRINDLKGLVSGPMFPTEGRYERWRAAQYPPPKDPFDQPYTTPTLLTQGAVGPLGLPIKNHSLEEQIQTILEGERLTPKDIRDLDQWLKDNYGKGLLDFKPLAEVPGSRPKDLSNLPAVIDAAAEVAGVGTDEPRPKTGKGQRFRGIGSLMRRRIFPLVQAVQLGYEHLLTDEQKAAVREFMESPAHELVGMEKSGLEYIRDYFGFGETEPEGEAIALPAPELPMDEASRMARAKEMGFDIGDPQFKGMYPYDWTKEVGDYKGPEITEINRTTEFPAFNKGEPGVNLAGFTASSPEVANRFAGPEGSVYPLLIKRGRELVIDAKGGFAGDVQFGESGKAFREAVKSGAYDSVRIINTKDEGDITAIITPENIRSRFAKFDPTKKDSADIGKAAGGLVVKPLYNDARII